MLLAHAFLRQAEAQLGLPVHALTDDAQAALRAHAWPGNVRELKATMRRVAILADSKLIRSQDLGLAGGGPQASGLRPQPQKEAVLAGSGVGAGLRQLVESAIAGDVRALATLRDEFVKRYVELAIERCDGDRDAAAKALEIGVRSLYRYIS